MQVHLPQDRVSRMTFSVADIDGKIGVGAGYAYMLDDDRNTAFTLSFGKSGSENAVRLSGGFEFGDTRKTNGTDISDLRFQKYDQRLDIMQRQLEVSQRQAAEYKTKHDEVSNLLVISQEHSEVCDESLSRCEDKVVGRK